MRHFTDRQPKGRATAWARIVSPVGYVEYRLFRRGITSSKPHMARAQFLPCATRKLIAGDLRKLRKALRDRVDEIDLAAMERDAA